MLDAAMYGTGQNLNERAKSCYRPLARRRIAVHGIPSNPEGQSMDEDVDILMSMYQTLSRDDIDAALKENGLTPTGMTLMST